MRIPLIVAAITIVPIVSACTPNLPGCSDTAATSLVKEIAIKKRNQQVRGLGPSFASLFDTSATTADMADIVTDEKSDQAVSCSASIQVNLFIAEKMKEAAAAQNYEPNNYQKQIEYKLQLTDDDGKLHASVNGL